MASTSPQPQPAPTSDLAAASLSETIGMLLFIVAIVSLAGASNETWWGDIGEVARPVILSLVALAAAGVGVAVGRRPQPLLLLKKVFFALSTTAVYGTTVLALTNPVTIDQPMRAALVAAATLISASILWRLGGGAPQHVAIFTSLDALAIAAVYAIAHWLFAPDSSSLELPASANAWNTSAAAAGATFALAWMLLMRLRRSEQLLVALYAGTAAVGLTMAWLGIAANRPLVLMMTPVIMNAAVIVFALRKRAVGALPRLGLWTVVGASALLVFMTSWFFNV